MIVNMEMYIFRNGKEYGPFPLEKVKRFLALFEGEIESKAVSFLKVLGESKRLSLTVFRRTPDFSLGHFAKDCQRSAISVLLKDRKLM